MDLESTAQLLGNLGEFFGAIAVVVTLGYLAVQIKQTRAETARTSRQSAQTAVGDVMLRIASNESVYLLFRRGMTAPDELKDEEVFRFDMVTYTIFDMWETMHSNWKRGRLADEDWRKWDTIIANYLTQEGIQQFWSRLSQQFSNDFRDYVDNLQKDENYAFGR